MPRALARVDGENTRFCPGYSAHQARSTSRPNAVSAAPNGRGAAAGSVAATPRAPAATGAGAAGAPHPVRAAPRLTGARPPREVLPPGRMLLGRLPAANGSVGGREEPELVRDQERGPPQGPAAVSRSRSRGHGLC